LVVIYRVEEGFNVSFEESGYSFPAAYGFEGAVAAPEGSEAVREVVESFFQYFFHYHSHGLLYYFVARGTYT
jgi:hypothetical protein